MGKKLTLQNNGFWFDSLQKVSKSPEEDNIAYLRWVPGPKGLQPRLSLTSDEQLFDLLKLALQLKINFMEFTTFRSCDPQRLCEIDRQMKANPL